MLTEDGLKTLEFNCRFGDPETQVVLPLLESDLVEIALACVRGELAGIADQIAYKDGSAACVVLASGGYPHAYPKGLPITGLDRVFGSIQVFHAGTAEKDGRIVTNGGRVLGVTATAKSLPAAVDQAYQAVDKIHFEGMQYRSDIGMQGSAYAAAGVSIETANQAMERIKESVNATHPPLSRTWIPLFLSVPPMGWGRK